MSDKDVIPEDANIFNMRGDVTFAQGDNGDADDKQNIRLTLYDGGVHAHWYWGNIAFDLATMRLAKGKVPILLNHDIDQRVGFSTGKSFEGKFVLEGRFLKRSPEAQRVREDIEDGFPFESSMSFDVTSSKTTRIADGETAQVNGKTVKGPGTAVYNAVIREGSITPFGALKNTKTQVFDENIDLDTKGKVMGNQEMTLDTFRAEHTDLWEKVRKDGIAEGEKKERDLFAAISEACPDAGLAVECFKEGRTADQAKDAFKDAEIERLKGELADKNKAAPPDPDAKAKNEFNASDKSDAHDPPDDDKKDFMKEAKKLKKAEGIKMSEAITKLRKDEPELFAAFQAKTKKK